MGSDDDVTKSDTTVPQKETSEPLGSVKKHVQFAEIKTESISGSDVKDEECKPSKRQLESDSEETSDTSTRKEKIRRNDADKTSDECTTGDSLAHEKSSIKDPKDQEVENTVNVKSEKDSDQKETVDKKVEYVSPFSKLIKTSGNTFLQAVKKDTEGTVKDEIHKAEDSQTPAEVIVKTWEAHTVIADDETLLFESKNCSVAHYDGNEWTVPIPVTMQLIAKKKGGSKRFVCYQTGTGKLRLNTTILSTMSVTKLKTRSIIFAGQLMANKRKLAPHRIIFQDQSDRDACHKHF
ncbi:uncharacterized protein BBOV_IV000185 [Babesia bovis T2Bo]|uniref:uncharacterized protein n=1 Tax=Babesia bovis T2Bo TaxID=484906 RepID=UPI001D433EA1|nr:uncharacterized protein BBOV_IV000185 [Babesia bovis T2Bo]KAG6439889.1 hypothetical protein BBOV_IV000185 [Babesia bovis T2Bo]